MRGKTTYVSDGRDLVEGDILTVRDPKAGMNEGDTVVFCNISHTSRGVIRVMNPKNGLHYSWFTSRFRWPDRYGDIPVTKDNCIFND